MKSTTAVGPSKAESVATQATCAANHEDEWTNRKASAQATRAANARHASGRRRLVDPATCEREYSSEELEFMQAMHAYKQSSGRMFPTWSEVLEVLHSLGYDKVAEPTDAPFERPGAGGPRARRTASA